MTEWNDDRLDELNGRVNDGFAKVDQRFIRLEGEMKDGFAKVDERFVRLEGETREGFARVEKRFEQVATRESVAEVNRRMDRLYWAFVVLVLTLGGNLITHAT